MPLRKSQAADDAHIWIVDQVDGEWVSVELTIPDARDTSSDGESDTNTAPPSRPMTPVIKQFPRWLFPKSVKEGEVYRVTRDRAADTPTRSIVTIERDSEEENRLLERSRQQIARAKSAAKPRDPGGDIQL